MSKRPAWLKNNTVEMGTIAYLGEQIPYTVAKKEIAPQLPGFIGWVNPAKAEHLFISEEVPEEFRYPQLLHEIIEFKSYKGQPDRCRNALQKELSVVPPDILPRYIPYRRDFFGALLNLYDNSPAEAQAAYPPDFRDEIQQSYDHLDRLTHGAMYPYRNPARRIPEDVRAEIIRRAAKGDTTKDIAADTGESVSAINYIRRRAGYPAKAKQISPEVRAQVVDLLRAGYTTRQIGESPLGVSRTFAEEVRRAEKIQAKYQPPVFTPEMDALLGTNYDPALAKLWGIKRSSVQKRRGRLGIPAYKSRRKTEKAPPDILPFLGNIPEREIAALTGKGRSTILRWIGEAGVNTYKENRDIKRQLLQEQVLALVGTKPGTELAAQFGIPSGRLKSWLKGKNIKGWQKYPTAHALPQWIRDLLGSMSDKQATHRLQQEPGFEGISTGTVHRWRIELEKASYYQKRRQQIATDPLLGIVSDASVAKKHGDRFHTSTTKIRTAEKIAPAFAPGGLKRDKLPQDLIDILGTRPDLVLAALLEVDVAQIIQWRRMYRIPAYARVDIPHWIHTALGTNYDHVIARRFGVAIPAITQWREELGIVPFNEEEPQIFPDVQQQPTAPERPIELLAPALVAILGTRPASEIAQQQRVSVAEVEQWHSDRGILLYKYQKEAVDIPHEELEEAFDSGFLDKEIVEYTGLPIEVVIEERDRLRPLSTAVKFALAAGQTNEEIASKQGVSVGQVVAWRAQRLNKQHRKKIKKNPYWNPPDWYDNLHKRNKGVFWRGSRHAGAGGGGDVGALGRGLYLAWDKGMAEAFATSNAGNVYTYRLPEGLNLLDAQSKEMADIKASMGFQPWEASDSPLYATIVTNEATKLGYDGVISDNRADGLVVFDPETATLLPTKNPDKRQRAFLKKRCDELLAEEPRMQELIDKLLALGGEAVVCVYEEDLDILLDGGHGLPAAEVQDYTVIEDIMETSQCHQNVALLFLGGAINAIATGWALTNDGLWRQHSWGIIDVDGTPAIIETTMKRDIYWGVRLTKKISEAVADYNLG